MCEIENGQMDTTPVWANTIRFLDKTFATQHQTPQNDPKNSKNDPSKGSPLYHAHKAQGRAEIKIIRYMKRVKTEFLSSKSVRFSKQISNAHISAPVRDIPSNLSLRGRPESQL